MMGPDSPNPLVAERQPLFAYMGCSVLFHIGALASAWLGGVAWSALFVGVSFCHDEKPKPSIEVSVYTALPKSRLNVPDRAAVAPRRTGQESPIKEPPPVKQSDLVVHKEQPEPKPDGNDAEARRQELLAKIERERLMEELLNAPDGPVDRRQTDPNGVEGLDLAVLGAAAQGDPAFARWAGQVQRLMMSHFRPLTQGRDDLRCRIKIWMDTSSGQIKSWEIVQPSGVLAFDSAAESAVGAVGTLPPPPERFRPLVDAEGFAFDFEPPR